MLIYLGVNSQIRILRWKEDQKPKSATGMEREAGKEAGRMLCISIYSIRGHAPVGRLPLAIRLPTALRYISEKNPHILSIFFNFKSRKAKYK